MIKMDKKIVLAALIALPFATTLHAQDTTTTPSKQDSATRPKSSGGFFGKILDAVTQPAGGGALGGLSSNDIASGLKEALRIGISKGADQASVTDGYFKNALLRIAVPPEAQKVVARLRQIGLALPGSNAQTST